jgi:hypothetical protein
LAALNRDLSLREGFVKTLFFAPSPVLLGTVGYFALASSLSLSCFVFSSGGGGISHQAG